MSTSSKIDKYTRSLLLFSDKNNPLKDEIGLKWTKSTGTITIVDIIEGNFKKAAYFNKAYIEMTPNFSLAGTEDFTMDMYFKTASQSVGDSLYSMTSSASGNSYGIGTFYHSEAEYALEYWGSLNSTSPIYYYRSNAEFQKQFCHYALEYIANEKKMYCFLNGKLLNSNSTMNIARFTPTKIYVGHHHWSQVPTFTGWLYYFRVSNCSRWKTNYNMYEAVKFAEDNVEEKNTTIRYIKCMYDIKHDSLYNFLYNYNTDDKIFRNIIQNNNYNNDTLRDINKLNNYNNDTLRDINKINIYNNNIYCNILRNYIYNNDTYKDILNNTNSLYNTLRNVLYNINPLYKDTYRYINKLYNPLYDTKRNIKHDYINILYNTKRLIHNNINIINYVHRKKILSNNINNDTVRSVISWKHKIIAFITNPRYKLKVKRKNIYNFI